MLFLFSGMFSQLACNACGWKWERALPSSILAYVGCVGLATGILFPVVKDAILDSWACIGLVLLANIAVLGSILVALDACQRRLWPPPRTCVKCGAPMQKAGGGFYDSLLPEGTDLIALGVFAAYVVGVVLALR